MPSELLHEAISMIRAGKMDDARQLLFNIIRNEPQNEVAWIWLAETFSSDLDRLKVLQACHKNNPDSKIVSTAINKLRKKIDNTVELSPSINPFLEGGTYDPAARERTGHTGAIIGFDGAFIVSDIPDFDEVVDLRAPKTSVLNRSDILITKPIQPPDESSRPAQTAALKNDDLEDEQPFEINPSIFMERKPRQTDELKFEPDLSSFLYGESPLPPKPSSAAKADEPIDFELPKVMQYNPVSSPQKPSQSPPASIFQPIKAIEMDEPAPPVFIPDAPVQDLRTEAQMGDSFLNNNYGEDETPKPKGIRKNVLMVAGLFAVIILLCLVTTMVLSGYSFGGRTATPTLPAIFIDAIIPTEPKMTLPPILSPTLGPSITPSSTPTATYTQLPTNTPTETPLVTGTPSITPTRTRTRTLTATPTQSPILSATASRTPTVTRTPMPTTPVQPTATFTQVNTNTPVNTPTRTLYPTSTNTPIPPTATNTPIPPTDTPVPSETDTPVPTGT